MQKTLTVWATLARHLRPASLARDAALLVAIGALAAFAVLYAGRLSFDRAVWSAGLDYEHQAAGAHVDALAITTLPGFSVRSPTTGAGPIDHTRNATTVQVYDAGAATAAGRLYAPLLRAGRLDPAGVLIDEATASRLRAGAGDVVELVHDADESVLALKVTGVLAPYHQKGDYGNGGVLVLPSAVVTGCCAAAFTDPAASITSYGASGGAPLAEAEPKWRAVLTTLSDEIALGPFVLVVLAIGLALWLAGVSRVASDLRGALGPHLSLVIELGCGPRQGRAFSTVVLVGIALLAGTFAALTARAFISEWTGFHVSAPQVWSAVVVLTLAAWLVARGGHLVPVNPAREPRP